MIAESVNIYRGVDSRFGGTSVAIPALASATHATGRIRSGLVVFRAQDDAGRLEGIDLPHELIQEISWNSHSPSAVVCAYKTLRQIVQRQNLVHFHGVWQFHTGVGSHLARQMRIPYLISAHGMFERWALNNKRWKKAAYARLIERRNLDAAACLRALTRAEAEDYRACGFRGPIAIVPNGVTLPTRISPNAFFQKWPGLKAKRIVLFLSRLHYKKGLDILCQAWRSLAGSMDDIHLVLAGPDSENTASGIEDFVQRESLTNSVTLAGMLDSQMKWSALSASTVFVLPSYSEGFSMAVLEALGAGRPVIITRQCNFPDLRNKEFAFVVEPDADELLNALKAALRLPTSSLDVVGRAARAYVENCYQWPRIGEMMADVYDWVLGGRIPSNVELSRAA
jgi:glycosyltransferase involved in cell wall biosynthesis